MYQALKLRRFMISSSTTDVPILIAYLINPGLELLLMLSESCEVYISSIA